MILKKYNLFVICLLLVLNLIGYLKVRAQISMEAGIPSMLSFRGFPKLTEVRTGFYVQTGYTFKNHIKIQLSCLRPRYAYYFDSENALLLGAAYVHQFKKVEWLNFNYGINLLYNKRTGPTSWDNRELWAVCPEIKVNVFVFKNVFMNSSLCMGYGKRYPYTKNPYTTNSVSTLPYAFSLGIGYSFKPKDNSKSD